MAEASAGMAIIPHLLLQPYRSVIIQLYSSTVVLLSVISQSNPKTYFPITIQMRKYMTAPQLFTLTTAYICWFQFSRLRILKVESMELRNVSKLG